MNSEERIVKALSISTDTKAFEMGQGVYTQASKLFAQYFPGRKAVIVADINTWSALGQRVYENFAASGIPTDKYIIEKERPDSAVFPDKQPHGRRMGACAPG